MTLRPTQINATTARVARLAAVIVGVLLALSVVPPARSASLSSSHARVQTYSRTGVYEDFGQLPRDWRSPYQLIDGIPLVNYGSFVARNPVTSAQYGLASWSLWRRYHDASRLRVARHVANWLVFVQRGDGKWTYEFPETPPGSSQTLGPGWSSSLAQAQALSLLERVYSVTHDPSYLRAIENGLVPLERSVAHGGLTHQFRGRIIFEEYPTKAINFSFNGDLQTLLGLYDVDTLVPAAHSLFQRGVVSVAGDLAIFNSHEGFSWYSIASRTHPPPGYDPAIRSQLRNLSAVTGRGIFGRYAAIWTAP